MEYFSGQLFPQLEAIRSVFFELVQICLFLAVLTLMMVELLKFLLKPIINRLLLVAWLDDLDVPKDQEEQFLWLGRSKRRRPWHLGSHRYVYQLPRRLFMKQLENATQDVMNNIHEHRKLFRSLTRGTSKEQQDIVIEWSEGEIQRKSERDSEMPRIVATAFDAVGAALNRNLDNLQLELTHRWILYVRVISLISGILLASVIGNFYFVVEDLKSRMLLLLLGAISGFMASLLYDLLARFLGKRNAGY